jgi:hypothetical protein
MKCSKITILLGLLLLVTTACQSRGQNLPFETIAQRDIINYREESPALFVIANDDEVDTLVPNVLAEDPALVDQLHQLDYERFFAILVLHGYVGSTGVSVTVQQITRQDNEVAVQARFVQPAPGTRTMPAFTSPYHLVAVSKQGEWGQQTRFVLVADSEEVVETSHFIP